MLWRPVENSGCSFSLAGHVDPVAAAGFLHCERSLSTILAHEKSRASQLHQYAANPI
jgi:hypothetical protein